MSPATTGSIENMQPRIELKTKGEVVAVVMCKASVSDGDLAAMLTDAEQDLRWNVMQNTETVHIPRKAGTRVGAR